MAELLLGAFRQVWAALAGRGVPAALMGGLAVAVWQHVRATRDVDLLVQVDLLLADSPYHREALARRIPATVGDLEVSVLACEDLVLHKLLAGRIIDRADVAALLRANREALDSAYLRRWSRELSLDALLA